MLLLWVALTTWLNGIAELSGNYSIEAENLTVQFAEVATASFLVESGCYLHATLVVISRFDPKATARHYLGSSKITTEYHWGL